MGCCENRPSDDIIKQHSEENKNSNDKYFCNLIVVQNIIELKKEILNYGNDIKTVLPQLMKLQEQLRAKILECKNKIEEIENYPTNKKQFCQNPALLIEIRKARTIPTTCCVQTSRPFVEVTIKSLNKSFKTQPSKP